MSYFPATHRAASPGLPGGLVGARAGRAGEQSLPRVLVAASGASRCGTTLTSALLAANTFGLGRDLLAVDATRSGGLRPLLGAQPVAEADAASLVPLFEAVPVSTGTAVLVDAGARLGAVLGALAAALAADLAPGLLVVTGTAPAQLAAAYALVKVAAERGLAAATEVVVVGGAAAEAADAFALLTSGVRRFLDRPLALAAHVPEDPSLAVALAAGMSVHDAAAGSPAAGALAPLAERWATPPLSAAPPAGLRSTAVPPRRPAVPGLTGPLAFAAASAR